MRVNAVGTEWLREDLEATLVPGLEAICLPKVERPEQVVEIAAQRLLELAER